MRKKIFLLAAAIALMAVTSYGTTAYFVAQETAYNVITMGELKMILHDNTLDGEEEVPFPETGIDGVVPTTKADKLVYLENVGSVDFYGRVALEKRLFMKVDGVEKKVEFNDEHIKLDINETDWIEKDGYYYYRNPLKPGEKTERLFTKVSFAPEMGNEYAGARVEIVVSAQAVQSKNNGETVLDAKGWPADEE